MGSVSYGLQVNINVSRTHCGSRSNRHLKCTGDAPYGAPEVFVSQ
jgi:hypothetical protein